ncbi:hypothetical protein LAZ67_8001173 [Cordylochernes scorpioides]|uniref:Integrase catalytic domain-containing protein n=1 Tax=Cordylochernes scorpioides TaxID=51811 RepID=A0ABY6KQH8_9ARAC|nr:hypothetical protein LAZ67_8001173 [Cordylochernes scorpioides]
MAETLFLLPDSEREFDNDETSICGSETSMTSSQLDKELENYEIRLNPRVEKAIADISKRTGHSRGIKIKSQLEKYPDLGQDIPLYLEKLIEIRKSKVSSAELKKLRTPVRVRFTKAFNELETEIKKNEVKKADVEKILRRLQTHHEKLSILNMRMEEALLRESASEDIFTAEYESVCEYEDNFSNIMTDYEALAEKDDVSTISGTAPMNYQLPKQEFKKFGGEPREWITFWSQFSTIDRDPQMPPETKFQYLFQATAENSEVREAVESFPPSADNYPKVIEYIKSRFGEYEMLVEIYVRDLFQNVLQNVRAEGKMSVVKLYDRLETQLRALETLGVARDKFAAMLYPLVESALPEDTLRVWERSQYTMRNNCIFCGNGHPSQECYSGQRMHLPEKKDKAKGKNVCFWCLLPGHGFKKCRIKPRCPVCGGKHYPIMCPTLEAQKTSHLQKNGTKGFRGKSCNKQETANQFTSTTLNNATVGGVYLQTLIVKISGPKEKHNVRVLLDCGSQRSYISKRMVDALGLKRVQQVTLTHNLLNNEYMDDLKFLDQEVICGHISQVQDHTILNELKARGINLTDICQAETKSRKDLIEASNTHFKEITTLTKSEDWNHVAEEHNPADLPSRGESPSKFTKSGWWEGPKWLKEKKEDWPVSKVQYDLEAIEEERRKTVVVGFVAKKPEENPWYLNLYEGKREVTLTQILRVIAWMLGFKPSEYKGDIISQEELDSAEKSLVKIIQSESIGEEDPKMKQLHAFQDKEGLWRVKTRIVNRNDDELFRLPILIPTNHPVTELIVKSVHEKMYHCGAQTLRSVLREKFWIPKARQLVRHVIHKCPRCRRFETKRVDVPKASLPQHRVLDVVVFEVTGIDLGGPLYLEDGQKVWFVIFTCGVYRAVHLELVTSLSTEALVGAVERFVARRGCPAVIYSDNGTNLVGLRNEFYRVNFGVKWKLNPPAAPWWGGWIERIVGLTKKLLRRLLGKRVVNYEEMVTILENCERVINARPLTYIAEDNDDPVPLTPEMFLREPRAEGEIDLNEFRCNFGKSYEKRKRLLKEFRKRFRSEYLGLLVHHDNRKKQRQLKVGDIVLVEVENRKQINWPMGKITKVFPGTDNVRRLVEVKTKSGFMKRAVQRLFPLEVPSEDVEQGDGELKPAEDEIVREKTSGVESASVQEKTTPATIQFEVLSEASAEEHLIGIGQVIGFENIHSVGKINGQAIVSVADQKQAEALLNNGFKVRDRVVYPSPLFRPSRKYILSGVLAFIQDQEIEETLALYGQVLSIRPLPFPTDNPLLKHLSSLRREIVFKNKEKTPMPAVISITHMERHFKVFIGEDVVCTAKITRTFAEALNTTPLPESIEQKPIAEKQPAQETRDPPAKKKTLRDYRK